LAIHHRRQLKLHPNYTHYSSLSYNPTEIKMPLSCNIDARGKRSRLITGIILLALAIIVGAGAWAEFSRVATAIAVLLAISGAFTVFEARAGWCVVRAMGFKTRI